jgi:septum site-determining protein MinC
LAVPEPAGAAARRGPALTITETVRGGQQIVAAEGDLVVAATVGHGAEVAAAGHVHVYGPLRGRAFAGIEGDEGAMIFCDQLEAQLLSIAGVHLVNEEIDPKLLGRRARVRLERERLVVQPVG